METSAVRKQTLASRVCAYQCPISGKSLECTMTRAASADGSAEYPVRDGCILFSNGSVVESDEEISRVRHALNLSRTLGWRGAIDAAYGSGSYSHHYITDARRAAFLDLLPLNNESVALEIGCSMGQHTQEIATRCAMVYGLEVIPEQAMFTQARCSQLGLENVSVACGGQDAQLPYMPGSFDVVVLNLVFEWCGSRSDEHHETVQRRMLSEISRVLKPGGALYLNTKNRFSIALLLGRPDEHSHGMRFGSALPRRLLGLLMRCRGIKKPPGWLHSYTALRSMVSAAGFSSLSSYWAAPEMRHPRQFIPTDSNSIRVARRRLGTDVGPGRIQRICLSTLPVSLVKHVTPGLCLVAIK